MHSTQDLPSLSSSVSSSAESSPRSSTTNYSPTTLSHSRSLHTLKAPLRDDTKKSRKKRHHSCEEPVRVMNALLLDNKKPISRWDDSQLEIELAEDDLIDKKVRRSSSLRLKLASESLKEKFRNDNKSNRFAKFKRLYDWLL